MLITTTYEIEGKRIVSVLGMVRGNTVRARAIGRDIMGRPAQHRGRRNSRVHQPHVAGPRRSGRAHDQIGGAAGRERRCRHSVHDLRHHERRVRDTRLRHRGGGRVGFARHCEPVRTAQRRAVGTPEGDPLNSPAARLTQAMAASPNDVFQSIRRMVRRASIEFGEYSPQELVIIAFVVSEDSVSAKVGKLQQSCVGGLAKVGMSTMFPM